MEVGCKNGVLRMRKALAMMQINVKNDHTIDSMPETVDIWDIVSGDTPIPTDKDEQVIWKRKDRAAMAMLMQCIDDELVVKICNYATTKEALDRLEKEFGQTGAGSIMHWFRHLTNRLERDSDLAVHIRNFQQACTHLQKAGFSLSGSIASAIFLSTLPSDPDDSKSWYQHVKSV
ncbi:hypothetical protein B0H14DRAFT_3705525 [Mycena olivaceomarginata]|nr:hypothetical protein B0H14DRAFT_3705525 [Mycena olivaceomarginata]